VEPGLARHVVPAGGDAAPGPTAPFADAPWLVDGLAVEVGAGVRGVDEVATGVDEVDPAWGEVAHEETASTAPTHSDAATRCVVRIEQTRGTR
jgi:hypothetical protein